MVDVVDWKIAILDLLQRFTQSDLQLHNDNDGFEAHLMLVQIMPKALIRHTELFESLVDGLVLGLQSGSIMDSIDLP